MHNTKNLQVLPTPELLSEMQELEILGGSSSGDVNVYTLGQCNVTYSGNCVPNCNCTIKPGKH